MRIAITGHRPEDIENLGWVESQLVSLFEELTPTRVFVGMAAGVDLLAGKVALELGYPVVACKPWMGHTARLSDRKLYQQILDGAVEVVNVNPAQSYPGAWVYHNRNKYMVDNADWVIAVWTGKSTGGTAACVKTARSQKKNIIQVNPSTLKIDVIQSNYDNDALF